MKYREILVICHRWPFLFTISGFALLPPERSIMITRRLIFWLTGREETRLNGLSNTISSLPAVRSNDPFIRFFPGLCTACTFRCCRYIRRCYCKDGGRALILVKIIGGLGNQVFQ